MLQSCVVLLALCTGVSAHAEPSVAATPAWFSDEPPSAEWAGRTRSSHGGKVERGRGGVYHKRLWYREGAPLNQATYPAARRAGSHELLVFGPKGETVEPSPFQADEGNGILFAMPEEGFYNAYLVMRQVEEGTLHAEVVKAEVLKHSCGEGHDRKFTESRIGPGTTAAVPFEIIRERVPDENFHTRLSSGDTLFFRVLYRGEPAAGATVSMITELGWTRRVTVDKNGRAYFQLIRDYYPTWSWFNKREMQSFLVTAEFEAPETGSHEGNPYSSARYSASLPGWYFPSPRDYQSYIYGLLVMLAAFALVGGGVYFYRLKQTRPSREKFDEKA